MSIYTIGDLHLSLGGDKPMHIFDGWENHVSRLETQWKRLISPADTVLLAGDTSWAMRLEDCLQDFSFINSLPGEKYIIKGNHDYWWTTRRKMERFCQDKGLHTLHFLQNDCAIVGQTALCGTRGWFFDMEDAHNEKMRAREAGRLRASLEAAGDLEKIAFLHYPPLYQNQRADDMLALLAEYGVKQCYYGHLHGKTCLYAFQGIWNDISYKLISSDSLGFCPYKIK